jgi:8-oxo-dGTP diphosphatase
MTPNQVAIAILYQDHRFLMQLRDEVPGIVYPGLWGFFGGHIELGEAPDVAVKRELLEEIGYAPPVLTEFHTYESPEVIRHVFYAPLTVPVEELELYEGWDLGLFTVEDVRRGDRYSEKAGQVRPMAQPPRQILLDFLERGLMTIDAAHG